MKSQSDNRSQPGVIRQPPEDPWYVSFDEAHLGEMAEASIPGLVPSSSLRPFRALLNWRWFLAAYASR
jgi:hypothetical protein